MRSVRVVQLVAIGCLALVFAASVRAASAQEASRATAPPLPENIPLFPLDDVMLFPTLSRPFMIYEPRYRAMIADALKGDRIIGMVMLIPGHEAEYEGRPPIAAIGCAGTIADFEELPDGRYNILLKGLTKFRILSEDQSRPYRMARVEAIPEATTAEGRAMLRKLRPSIENLFSIIAPGAEPPPADLSDEDLVNAISQYLDFTVTERQRLLEAEGAVARAQAVIRLLEMRPPAPR